MVRGFYAAASGVLTQQRSINVISNNISNVLTAGYKSQATIESSFGAHLVSRMSSNLNHAKGNIGSGSFMTVTMDAYTNFAQGPLEQTGRNVDMAINGTGFFLIETEKHGDVLTRNGQFEIDKDGDLTLPGVGKVLDDEKRNINVGRSDFVVNRNGDIQVDGDQKARLFIGVQDEEMQLIRVGEDTYYSKDGYGLVPQEEYSVVQGSIEKGNVNMAEEMSKIIAKQSNYQSCSQLLKIYDSINEICVNRIGEVR